MKAVLCVAAIVGLVMGTGHARAAMQEPLTGLDTHIIASMRAWDTAGLAIAIVKDGSIVMERGFGLRDVRTKEPVDANTVFAIGSMTKSITAIAAGTLVDQDKLDWDDRLSRHVPGFAVGDPYIGGAATIRDALSHRTGFDWSIDPLMISAKSKGEIIDRVAHLTPARPFRAQFDYSNIIYIIASEAIGAASGQGWEALVTTSIFEPLGMKRSTTNTAALRTLGNVATPHRNLGAGPQPVTRANTAVTSGAGAINASAHDLAMLLTVLANGGRMPNRADLLRTATLDEIFNPQINIGVDATFERFTNFHSYGLGWELIDYKGRKVAFHGGAIDGMLSQMAVVPAERLGIVILTNTDGARYLPDALVSAILDRFLGGEQPDWNTPYLARGTRMREILYGTPLQQRDTKFTQSIDAYAGTYRGPLGDMVITSSEKQLQFRYGVLTGPLQHWHYDTFRGAFATYGDRLVTFAMGSDGRPARVSVEFIGDFQRVSQQ
jgi:CubicO group peptidase (beta-lactamase class C family)